MMAHAQDDVGIAGLEPGAAHFRIFVEQAPAAIAMLDRDLCYVAASRRWYEDYALPTEALTGRRHYDVFPEIPELWKQAHRRALDGEVVSAREERFDRAEGGALWLNWEVRPWYAEDGRVGGLLIFTEDVTARKLTELRLIESNAFAVQIMDALAANIAVIDARGRIVSVNRGWTDFAAASGHAGHPSLVPGANYLDACVADPDAAEALAGIRRTLTEGVSYQLDYQCADDWYAMTVAPMSGGGAVITHVDISERKRSETRQRILVRELAHRGKNLLAVIQAMANLSLTGMRSVAEARDAFNGRLQSLANTYSSLTDEQFEGAPINEIVTSELASFGTRATVGGPRIMVAPKGAQTLALVVHELATNAAKYGALSTDKGRLAVRWEVVGDQGDANRRFRFEWRESGGPPVRVPAAQGFGSTIMTTVAAAEFKCQPVLDYAATGLRYGIDAPLSAVGVAIEESPLRARLQADILLDFHDCWMSIRTTEADLPDWRRFEAERFADGGGLTLAEIGSDGGVDFLSVGHALGDRLGATADYPDWAGDRTALADAVRRCAESGVPCYENLRFDFGNAEIVTFERLLLPFAAAGRSTRVAGLVIYTGERA